MEDEKTAAAAAAAAAAVQPPCVAHKREMLKLKALWDETGRLVVCKINV